MHAMHVCACLPACLSACVLSLLQSVICYIWLLLFCDIRFWRWIDFDAEERRKEEGTRTTKWCAKRKEMRKNDDSLPFLPVGIFALCRDLSAIIDVPMEMYIRAALQVCVAFCNGTKANKTLHCVFCSAHPMPNKKTKMWWLIIDLHRLRPDGSCATTWMHPDWTQLFAIKAIRPIAVMTSFTRAT